MNEIRQFLAARAGVTPLPSYYILYRGDEVLSTVDAGDENAPSELESAIRADLAFCTGRTKYTLLAQDNAGAQLAKRVFSMVGTGSAKAESEAATVNANLVALVSRMSATTLDQCEVLFRRQDDTIKALLDSNKALAMAHIEGMQEQPQNPAVVMAQQRVDRLIEIGMSGVMQRFLGAAPTAAQPAQSGIAMGKHAELRAFIACDLEDGEIDSILSIVMGAGLGEEIMKALGEKSLSKALKIMGGG
jgi:hypothetical protein